MKWKLGIVVMISFYSAAAATPVIIDTDAGTDDLMAIAFVLARRDVTVEAITIAGGLAHVPKGAANVVRLVALSGRADIPVYPGKDAPLQGNAEFPTDWRRNSDELPGVSLPNTARHPRTRPAADYLVERLKSGQRVRILALGPLTNLGEALHRNPAIARAIEEIVIMGGAVRVPGNTKNNTAEWNIFIDPLAARRVFTCGAPLRLVPLDATNKVPIGLDFLTSLQQKARSPITEAVGRILETERDQIAAYTFFAWDPLAAVALVEPKAVRTLPLHIVIRDDGTTAETPGAKPNAQVALDADASRFRRVFLDAF